MSRDCTRAMEIGDSGSQSWHTATLITVCRDQTAKAYFIVYEEFKEDFSELL